MVRDEVSAFLRHCDERRHVLIHQGLLEGGQLAESVDLADAVFAQRALKKQQQDGGLRIQRSGVKENAKRRPDR